MPTHRVWFGFLGRQWHDSCIKEHGSRNTFIWGAGEDACFDVMTLRCLSKSSKGFHLLWFRKTELTFELGARQRCMQWKSGDSGEVLPHVG